MKKIISTAVMIMMMLSIVPLAFAEDPQVIDATNVEGYGGKPQLINTDSKEIEDKETTEKSGRKRNLKQRLLQKERDLEEKARKYSRIRDERIAAAKGMIQEAETAWGEAKECFPTDTAKTCPAVGNVADAVLKMIDRGEEFLNQVLKHAEQAEDQEIIEETKEHLETLDKFRVTFSDPELTKDGVKLYGNDFKKFLTEIKEDSKKIANKRIGVFFDNTLRRLNNAWTKVEKAMNKRDFNADQKAEINALIDEGKALMSELEAQLKEHEYRIAKATLREVHEVLKDIFHRFREYSNDGGSLRTIADERVDVSPVSNPTSGIGKEPKGKAPTIISGNRVKVQQRDNVQKVDTQGTE